MSLTAIYAKKALIGEELQVLEDACILVENEKILEIIPRAQLLIHSKPACHTSV